MNWILMIAKGKAEEYVHAKLLKYGIGTHVGPRAKVRFTKNRITFKADLDYEQVFIDGYLRHVPRQKQKTKGVIISYEDRTEEFDKAAMPLTWTKSKGKSATTYKAKISGTVPLEHLEEVANLDGPTTFFLLTMSPVGGSSSWKVSTKTSFPKSPASGEDEDEKDPNFCTGAFENTSEVVEYLLEELIPNLKDEVSSDVKEIYVRHKIVIDEIEIPKDPNMSFAEKRKKAKKIGKIIRRVSIDDKEFEDEYSFKA